MQFIVTIGSRSYSAITATFMEAAQALAEARNQVAHGQTDVSVREVATGRVFNAEEFAKKMIEDAGREASAQPTNLE